MITHITVAGYPIAAYPMHLYVTRDVCNNVLLLTYIIINLTTSLFKDNCTLTELDIGGNSIGDDGILIVCKGMRRNSVMKELRLKKCGISVKGKKTSCEFVIQ